MEIKFATAETLIQPKGGLILEAQTPEDYVLGSNDPKNLGQVVLESGDWTPYLPAVIEIQRLNKPDSNTGEVDTFWCTIFSDNEIDETIHKKKYGTEINISEKFVAVGSLTQRGFGNSMKAAADFKRKNGFLFEDEMPFNKDGTMDEAYSLNTQADMDKAKPRATLYNSGYLAVGSSGQEAILDALKISPLKIAIQGREILDADGRLQSFDNPYTHAVMLFAAIVDADGKVIEYHIDDSETKQYLRMRGDYAFLNPMVKFFEKKSMKYKIAGHSAVFYLDPIGKNLVPFGSGKVYKTIQGEDGYKGIVEVPNLQALEAIAPLADWIITESPWDKTSFINSLS